MAQQEEIPLDHSPIEDVSWSKSEKRYVSEASSNTVVSNVSEPKLILYKPDVSVNNGIGVIIAPGGGLYYHSIVKEGERVAQWLASKGYTAFILKYRLVPTTQDDAVKEIGDHAENNLEKLKANVFKVIPYSVQDGLEAMSYVRKNASFYNIDPNKIGMIGFSAGGAVALGVNYNYQTSNRPDFLVTVYPWIPAMPIQKPKSDSPPLLIITATDDGLGLAADSINLYNSYYENQIPVGLHMYPYGGHGFGLTETGLSTDKWLERFDDWIMLDNILK